MTDRPRRGTNPFYVLLLLASTAFVVTALGYAVGPSLARREIEHPQAEPNPRSRALAAWFERRGPTALGVEFAVMLVAGLAAMATDRLFTAKPARGPSGSRSP